MLKNTLLALLSVLCLSPFAFAEGDKDKHLNDPYLVYTDPSSEGDPGSIEDLIIEQTKLDLKNKTVTLVTKHKTSVEVQFYTKNGTTEFFDRLFKVGGAIDIKLCAEVVKERSGLLYPCLTRTTYDLKFKCTALNPVFFIGSVDKSRYSPVNTALTNGIVKHYTYTRCK